MLQWGTCFSAICFWQLTSNFLYIHQNRIVGCTQVYVSRCVALDWSGLRPLHVLWKVKTIFHDKFKITIVFKHPLEVIYLFGDKPVPLDYRSILLINMQYFSHIQNILGQIPILKTFSSPPTTHTRCVWFQSSRVFMTRIDPTLIIKYHIGWALACLPTNTTFTLVDVKWCALYLRGAYTACPHWENSFNL